MAAAEPFWRRLEAGRALATPYQRFDLLAAWQHHVGARGGVTPFMVTGFDAAASRCSSGRWPHPQRGRCTLVKFLGSKHANFNGGLWRRDVASAISAQDIRGIFERIASCGHRVDLLALYSQPLGWDGIANPFALLPHQSSVDISARQHFDRPGDERSRRC